jgi:hypothetical protein
MEVDGRLLQLDAFGPEEKYRLAIMKRARGWLENGIPRDAGVPPGLGNWFFGVVVEGSCQAIMAAHDEVDRSRLAWSAWCDALDDNRFTIEAEALPRRPALVWDADNVGQ